MTATPVISLKGVSKKYRLYESLRHRLYEALHPFKRTYHREFWALRDIDLDIPRGATVGILGVNGSGKSTLLQIICSILQATSGTVEVRGRVAALIELGAGFNPELTGRKNAEINSMIMGLSNKDARARLPAIEAFADIGEFFDQPVKIYSSGMFMRVAFATAITVDPDILVVDEALAVGDAKFQQKCFRKFRDFQAAGKTIILVTHDRSAVPRLCSFAALLHRGRLLCSGSPKEVTDRYSELLTLGDQTELYNDPISGIAARPPAPSTDDSRNAKSVQEVIQRFLSDRNPDDRCQANATYNRNEFCYGLGGACIIDYLVVAGDATNPANIETGVTIDLYVRIRFDRAVNDPLVGFSVKTRDGTLVYGTHSGWLRTRLAPANAGTVCTYKFSVRMDLGSDDWFMDLAVASSQEEVLHTREAIVHLRVVSSNQSTGFAALKTMIAEL